MEIQERDIDTIEATASTSGLTVNVEFLRREGKTEVYQVTTNFDTDKEFIEDIDQIQDLVAGYKFNLQQLDKRSFILSKEDK